MLLGLRPPRTNEIEEDRREQTESDGQDRDREAQRGESQGNEPSSGSDHQQGQSDRQSGKSSRISNGTGKSPNGSQEHVEPFIPFAYLVGKPDQVKAILDAVRQEEKANTLMKDEGFDAISKALMADDPDMIPILTQANAEVKAAKDLHLEEQIENMKRALGIRTMSVEEAALSTDAKIKMKSAQPSEAEQRYLADLLPPLDSILEDD